MFGLNDWSLLLSAPMLSCFDGDDDAGGDPPSDDPPGDGGKKTKLFTQDDVDKLMANHRKGLQKQIEGLTNQLEASKGQDTEALRLKIDEMSQSLKTKEQQAAEQEKRLKDENEKKVKTAEERASQAEQTLRSYKIEHALQSAAVSADAFNPNQVVTQLRHMTVVNDEGQVKVKGLFKMEDGEESLQDPAEAIKWMREHPEEYGNFFKSNVVGGIGGSSAPSGMPGKSGKVNVKKLTPAEYQKLRKENPEALGFKA